MNPYAKFLLGTKIGMTNVFTDSGMAHPATVIEAGPCFVSQIKNHISDGYNSVQIGFKMDRKANKPKKNHFEKNKCEPLKHVKEFRINEDSVFALGEKIDVKVFSVGEYVNVTGTSKGKGFAGVMKRHGFAGGRASHGKNSVMRKPGSVGAGADPSRIWKGKKMPGRYGGYTVTCKNLEILKIDVENNLLFIKGAVPGANNNLVSIAI
ncbi:MAG: 50S ribosomal protein L3 [Candidatus Neomarinimicrobiota bacterium]